MQTTLTSILFENQDDIQLIKNQLDTVVVEHSLIQRKLYKDIISYKLNNKVKELLNTKINELKSSYQLKYNINARQYNSIYLELTGKISSVIQLNKGYIADTKSNIKSLNKTIQTKNKTLTSAIKYLEIYNKDLINKDNKSIQTKLNILENNINNLNKKLFYLNKDVKGEWRWRIKSNNEKIVGDSGEGYKNKQDAIYMINKIIKITEYEEEKQVG